MDSEGIEELFTKDEIYYSSVIQMNDPFECRPVLTVDTSTKAMRKYLKQVEKKHLRGLSYGQRRRLKRDAARRFSSPERREEIHYGTVSRYGFYCLSELPDHPLMWAHYADMHRGFSVEFNTEADRRGYFARAQPVIYSLSRPVVDILWTSAEDTSEEIVDKTFLTKSSDWSYEKEYRILNLSHQGIERFPPQCLSGVVFGCRMQPEDRERITSLALARKSPPTIYEAVMNPTTYELDINGVD